MLDAMLDAMPSHVMAMPGQAGHAMYHERPCHDQGHEAKGKRAERGRAKREDK